MSAVLADSSAALKTSPGTSIADRVKAQLQRDYPPGALSWVDDLAWSGPTRVPLGQIDKASGDTEWSAAAADKLKLQRFQKRIAAGWRKPVVLVRSPGSSRMFAVDGHTRILSCEALGQPVTAWVGTAKTATGPWRKVHSRQLANDDGAVELSALTPVYSSTPSPLGRPGGPGLWFKGWKLPDYIENVARGIMQGGTADESQAIATAIAACKRWAAGGGKVTPEVRAAAGKAIAEWEALKAAAPGTPSHAHAGDFPAIELAGMFNEALHPRVAKGNTGGGRFGAGNTPLTAGARGPVRLAPAPAQAPEPPAELQQIRQLRFQASKDRHLARKILIKVAGLVRARDGYIAGTLTAAGKANTSVVNPARSAAAKKAAATRKASGKTAKRTAKRATAGAAKATTVAKMNGEIRLLRNDARALIRSANKLDAQANGL
jgi:hypothetical protein